MELKMSMLILGILLVAAVAVYGTVVLVNNEGSKVEVSLEAKNAEQHNPQINPNDFVSFVNNKYFSLVPGTKYVYQGSTEEGVERVEVFITHETRKVMGINTIVVHDKEWLNDGLVEDTRDWYAQDKQGNVWYFGEDSKEVVDGVAVSAKGSWEAGINGAKPGIIMKANPVIGEAYRQEYYEGEAEDVGEAMNFNVTVTVAAGTFTGCLQTREWNLLEADSIEYKYYCPQVRNVVLEVSAEDGESMQLTEIEKNAEPQKQADPKPVADVMRKITEEEAITIAKSAVNGRVTDVAIEKKFGMATYVVEIDNDGTETDVIIDFETGQIMGIET